MKTFCKKFLVIVAIFLAIFATIGVTSSPNSTFAASIEANDDTSFLGLRPWNYGVGGEINGTKGLKDRTWIIASNIFVDISVVASYLVLGYVIYGGYLYMFSGGDVSKVTAGKRTLTNAFIGLAIVLLASIILNSINIALIGDNNGGLISGCSTTVANGDVKTAECVNANTLVTNLINWVIGISGVVAVVFVVLGGVGYMTSAGDAQKAAKARKTLTYALIGLAIVGLSGLITAFVSNTINSGKTGKTTSYINETIISKEVTYEN